MKKLLTADQATQLGIGVCRILGFVEVLVLLISLHQTLCRFLSPPLPDQFFLLLVAIAPAYSGWEMNLYHTLHTFRQIEELSPDEVKPEVRSKSLSYLHNSLLCQIVVIVFLFSVLHVPLWIILPILTEAVFLLLVRPNMVRA